LRVVEGVITAASPTKIGYPYVRARIYV